MKYTIDWHAHIFLDTPTFNTILVGYSQNRYTIVNIYLYYI